MDQLSTGGTAREGVRARRRQMRALARTRRSAADTGRFQTPEWLERSFVLPPLGREVSALPSQPQPHHDDFSDTPLASPPARHVGVDPEAAPTFVRPPSQEIDFARMIKRSDQCRTASRAAIGSIGFAGFALVIFLVTMDPVPLEIAIACLVAAVIAVGVRVRLARARVPHLGG